MLWGACLKSMGSEKIEGNPFLGKTYDKEQSLEEIYYLKEFVSKFDRDSKYYLGKPFTVDENKLKILDLYEEFINANEGFANVDTTDKIKLVGNLSNATMDDIELFKSKIDEVIKEDKLENLLIFCDKI